MKDEKKEIEEQIVEINKQIDLKEIEIRNGGEYQLLDVEEKRLREEKDNNERELSKLKKPIYRKYVNSFYGWGSYNFREKEIKSSVKQGIKKGLGITNVQFIREDDLKKIVKELIENDLGVDKIRLEKLEQEINNFNYGGFYDKKRKLIKDGLIELEKQRKDICNKRDKKKIDMEKRISENQILVQEKIKNNLQNLMPKIKEEVEKRLIIENLK